MNTDTLLARVEAKLLSLGYTPPDVQSVRATIRTTIDSDPPDWENEEEIRIAERDLVELVTEMGGPGRLATGATYQGGAVPPPPPSGAALGDIGSLIPTSAPPTGAGQTPGVFRATGNGQTPGFVNGQVGTDGKFAGPIVAGAGRAAAAAASWAARNPRLARYGGWLLDAGAQALAYTGGYAAGQAMSGAGTTTPEMAGMAEGAGVGTSGGVDPEITIEGVVSNLVALTPYFRDIWMNRGVLGEAGAVLAKGLQYIMTGNASVTPMDRCNFVADRFAEKFPDVADAISQFQCGLNEGIGLKRDGELVFMALKLHHAGVSFSEVCARCRR